MCIEVSACALSHALRFLHVTVCRLAELPFNYDRNLNLRTIREVTKFCLNVF